MWSRERFWELGATVFHNKCVAMAVTFSLLVCTNIVDDCLMLTDLTELSKCSNVWRLLHCRYVREFVQSFIAHLASYWKQFTQRFWFLMNLKRDGVCLKKHIDTITHWYNRWFVLHKNGMVDAVCKARIFLLEVVCNFSIVFGSAIASNVRMRCEKLIKFAITRIIYSITRI